MTERAFDTYRVTRLTCAACGYSDSVRILVLGSTEIMPECESCGRTDAWASWPTLAEPTCPAVEPRLVPLLDRPRRVLTVEGSIVPWSVT